MKGVEHYRRKIQTAGDIHDIVRTMKVMSSVSIRQFDNAAESLAGYFETVELALQVVLGSLKYEQLVNSTPKKPGRKGIIVLGAGQGLCGAFNEQITEYVLRDLEHEKLESPEILLLGHHLAEGFPSGFSVKTESDLPGSVKGIKAVAGRILDTIDHWTISEQIPGIYLYHHKPTHAGGFRPRKQILLPLNQHWLDKLAGKPWPSRAIPRYHMDTRDLFRTLVRQYLMVSLYRALAESLSAECTSRLNAMSRAEKRIDDRLSDLKLKYAGIRQNTVTEELLDIQSGYEVVRNQNR